MKRYALLLICLSAFIWTGCASQTTINSNPTGAKLKIDGADVGTTPYQYNEDSVWIWTKHQVQLSKEGYQDSTRQIKGEFSGKNIAIGILCCLPILFAGEYEPQYNFALQKSGTADLQMGPVADPKVETIKVNFAE